MAASPLSPLPIPTHPLVDPKTGQIDRVWYLYLRTLDRLVRELLEAP